MDRLSFIILLVLRHAEAVDKYSAMSVREILSAEELGVKENTIFKKIKGLIASGYVGQGMKDGKANTYFITPEGCERLKEERSQA